MKKLLILFAVFSSFIFVNAQEKNYQLSVAVLLQHAQNNFKDLLGEQLPEDPALSDYLLYNPKEQIGIGTEQIYVSKSDNSRFYICYVPLTEASAILQDVLNYVNMKAKNGDFIGEDIDAGNGKNVTMVKNTAGENVMKIETQYIKDDNFDNDYFALVINGRASK